MRNYNVRMIYLAGVPASGKTTLFRRIRERLFGNYQTFQEGKVKGIRSECGHYEMLGVFDGSTFEGTDRLSNSVIDEAIAYHHKVRDGEKKVVIFAEGDRLFNARFLSETAACVIIIDASPDVLAQRHRQRGDNQLPPFLKSRRTKVENFAKKYHFSRAYNNTPADSDRIFDYLIKLATDGLESI